MAHIFEYVTDIVRDAAIILHDNLTAANLCQRKIESKFAEKKGKTVKVKYIPDLGAADEFVTTTTATDIEEEYIEVTLAKHFYKKVKLTTDQMNFEVDDFNAQVANPMLLSIKESIDAFFIDQWSKDFARNLVGVAGNSPTTIAHILAARKKIIDNRGTYQNMAGIIDTAADMALLQLEKLISVDYGSERPMALRDNVIGKVHGATFFTSQNAGTHNRGNVAGTVLVNGDPGTGKILNIDGLDDATGTIYAGTRLVIAGDTSSSVYTIVEDATIASNAASLELDRAIDASVADNAAVTFQTAHAQNLLYNANAAYGAIIAPKPFAGLPSEVSSYGDLSIRASFESSTGDMSDTFMLDVYAGARGVHHSSGVVFNG